MLVWSLKLEARSVLAMKRLIYIVPTGLNGLGGCFLFYHYFAPIGAVLLVESIVGFFIKSR